LSKRRFECAECGHSWRVLHGSPKPERCPECDSTDFHRAESVRDHGKVRRHTHRDIDAYEDSD
jgi:hypothetical protein